MSEAPEHLLAIKLVGAKKATFLGGDTSGPFDATDYTRTDIVRAQIEAAVKRALESAAKCGCDFDGPVSRSDFVNGQATAAQQIMARISALDPAQFTKDGCET